MSMIMTLGPGGSVNIGSAATYTGPGDIASLPTAYAWYGLRAYTAAYAAAASPCLDLTNITGTVTATINIDPATGFINTTTAAAAIAANPTSRVSKYYDQSGNSRHLFQTSHGQRPTLNVAGSIYMYHNTSNDDFLISTGSNFTLLQPFMVSTVARRVSGTAGSLITGGSAAAVSFGTSGKMGMYAGADVYSAATVTEGAIHALSVIIQATTGQTYLDGTSTTGLNPGGGDFSAITCRIGGLFGSPDMQVYEVGLWAGNQSSFFSALNTNQHHATNGWNF